MAGEQHQVIEPHYQVIELYISYVDDLKTLLRVSRASSAQQRHIVRRVKQQLPKLLKQAVTAGVMTGQRLSADVSADIEALKWLLSTAGPAVVGKPAVAEALLRSRPFNILLAEQLPKLCFKRGLQLYVQQMVAASMQRVKGLGRWLVAAHIMHHHNALDWDSEDDWDWDSSRGSLPEHMTQLGDQYGTVSYTLWLRHQTAPCCCGDHSCMLVHAGASVRSYASVTPHPASGAGVLGASAAAQLTEQ